MIKSYPKVLQAVGKFADLVTDGSEVEITEKIDGSLFAFGRDNDGKLHMRSKGAVIRYEEEDVQKLFKPAVEHVLSVLDKLPNGKAFYCETLCAPRHNTLNYERVPKNHLMLFGVTDFDRTVGSDYDTLAMWAETLDIEPVPLIDKRILNDLSEVPELLQRKSVLGGVDVEGVVIKNYRVPVEFAGQVMPFAALKYVSEAFKEKHANNPEYVPQSDKLQELFDQYRTEARWRKAVQHLRDKGELTGEPKDIGALMKELRNDLVEEERNFFMEELYKLYSKGWKAAVTRGFPEWYKKELLTGTVT